MSKVNIVNKSGFELPQYKTEGSAGMDLRANIDAEIILQPLERRLVPTGLFIELPQGFEGQVRPRSGMSIKYGITLVNAVGTVDSDYRGELKVPVINLSNEAYTLARGERIAQLVVAEYKRVSWNPVVEITETERGSGGFGSTGKA